MATLSSSRVLTKDGIEWYIERQGQGPSVVLIPSGEGDCGSFAQVVSILSSSFEVTTFDMPGMSRSTAPEASMQDLTASKLATQVIGLMDELGSQRATFWGCSSGGLVALQLAADYPERVRNVVVHEVPALVPDFLLPLPKMSDEAIIQTCQHAFSSGFTENSGRWNALGPDYHKRLEKNFVTWARRYVGKFEKSFTAEELRKRPVCWTIGALTPAGMFWQNVLDGFDAGIRVGLLPSKHFPQVTVPDVLAEHIKTATEVHL